MANGLVVLISGRGSNLQAILESPLGEQVVAVISDNPDAAGLAIARTHNKPVAVCCANTPTEVEEQLLQTLAQYQPALIALAGFMRILSPRFLAACCAPLVNIHPSLLPAFRGLNTHRRVLAAGKREHGCSIHWVTAELDGGAVIACEKLTVSNDDDEESLANRVLAIEHRLYPRILVQLLNNKKEQ